MWIAMLSTSSSPGDDSMRKEKRLWWNDDHLSSRQRLMLCCRGLSFQQKCVPQAKWQLISIYHLIAKSDLAMPWDTCNCQWMTSCRIWKLEPKKRMRAKTRITHQLGKFPLTEVRYQLSTRFCQDCVSLKRPTCISSYFGIELFPGQPKSLPFHRTLIEECMPCALLVLDQKHTITISEELRLTFPNPLHGSSWPLRSKTAWKWSLFQWREGQWKGGERIYRGNKWAPGWCVQRQSSYRPRCRWKGEADW